MSKAQIRDRYWTQFAIIEADFNTPANLASFETIAEEWKKPLVP